MDLVLYIAFSAVYIMTIHFAIAIKNEFKIFQMVGLFVLGAVIGWYFNGYEIGFVTAVVLSLLFW
jgi:hypothetical protein